MLLQGVFHSLGHWHSRSDTAEFTWSDGFTSQSCFQERQNAAALQTFHGEVACGCRFYGIQDVSKMFKDYGEVRYGMTQLNNPPNSILKFNTFKILKFRIFLNF